MTLTLKTLLLLGAVVLFLVNIFAGSYEVQQIAFALFAGAFVLEGLGYGARRLG